MAAVIAGKGRRAYSGAIVPFARKPMKILVFTAALALLPGLVHARCVTAADLASGIAFKRQDGRSGLAQADGKGVTVDYATNATGAWQDLRQTDRGIYEASWAWTPTEEYYVGGGPGGGWQYGLQGEPPEPAPGESWTTSIRVRESHYDGTESGGPVLKYTLKAVYSYQAVKEAKLSGCTYRILPVEATFTGKNTHFTRRWIYFPDLGFGLETRVTDHQGGDDRKLGLTALTPM